GHRLPLLRHDDVVGLPDAWRFGERGGCQRGRVGAGPAGGHRQSVAASERWSGEVVVFTPHGPFAIAPSGSCPRHWVFRLVPPLGMAIGYRRDELLRLNLAAWQDADRARGAGELRRCERAERRPRLINFISSS